MKAIISSLMLLFFFTGQINLTVAAHYCGGELKSTAVTVSPEKVDCCAEDSIKLADPDCCSNEFSSSDADEYFGKTQFHVQFSPEFIIAYAFTLPSFELEASEISYSTYHFQNRSTPDLTILHQTFLI